MQSTEIWKRRLAETQTPRATGLLRKTRPCGIIPVWCAPQSWGDEAGPYNGLSVCRSGGRSFHIGVQFMKALLLIVALLSATVACGEKPGAATGWPFVGSDQAHTKYSAAEEITADNVGELQIVWQWEPNETPLEQSDTQPGPFQATPIMVDGILYLSTVYTRVAALDAETGAELWTFDPRAYEGGPVGAVEAPESQLGPIPLTNPPYAHLEAIDLNAGEIAWKVPFGEGSDEIRTHPLLRGVDLPARLGTIGNSGSMVTKGGLVFLGGGEPYLYAFDKATGAELWRGATPFPTNANPMTYQAQSGRQFVVIVTGHGADAALIAFARPD